jgi:DNA-directed RNA polymerase specialized sigma24 family protein
MPYETSPQHMSVEDLAQKCAQETQHFRWNQASDTQYCFELFRRAIANHDQVAWDKVITLYQWQVERWVRRYPDFQPSRDDEQDFVFEAFERFWKYFTPDKLNKSKNLAAVLSYLHMCVNGSVLDHRRKNHQRQVDQDEGEEERNPPGQDQVQVPEEFL